LGGAEPYLVTMILDRHTSFPTARTYVIKLHSDAVPERGLLFGKLENVSTGQQFGFDSGAELLAILARDAAEPRD
jgi:hypothetical protein